MPHIDNPDKFMHIKGINAQIEFAGFVQLLFLLLRKIATNMSAVQSYSSNKSLYFTDKCLGDTLSHRIGHLPLGALHNYVM